VKTVIRPVRIFGYLAFAFLVLGSASQSQAKEGCGIYPDEVYEKFLELGWSACRLKHQGQRPLWRDFAGKHKRVMRFVFTEGHGAFYRYVFITENVDGTGQIRTGGTNRRSLNGSDPIPVRRSSLSVKQLVDLNALVVQAKLWQFSMEAWDDPDEILSHCQLLEMEMATGKDYRYSSVSVGCNQPTKLMLVVDEVARLSGLKKIDPQRYR
jgi:hypothetical protein